MDTDRDQLAQNFKALIKAHPEAKRGKARTAALCDIGITTVHRIYRGEANLDLDTMLKICRAFNVPLTQLLRGIE